MPSAFSAKSVIEPAEEGDTAKTDERNTCHKEIEKDETKGRAVLKELGFTRIISVRSVADI